mmetsp:Transcript_6178/g.25623  ORF Transcript_6178/g.25623 Transcript_6178/m.25623 type:complete len:302 (-) Transcript_6178:800-1705(-)
MCLILAAKERQLQAFEKLFPKQEPITPRCENSRHPLLEGLARDPALHAHECFLQAFKDAGKLLLKLGSVSRCVLHWCAAVVQNVRHEEQPRHFHRDGSIRNDECIRENVRHFFRAFRVLQREHHTLLDVAPLQRQRLQQTLKLFPVIGLQTVGSRGFFRSFRLLPGVHRPPLWIRRIPPRVIHDEWLGPPVLQRVPVCQREYSPLVVPVVGALVVKEEAKLVVTPFLLHHLFFKRFSVVHHVLREPVDDVHDARIARVLDRHLLRISPKPSLCRRRHHSRDTDGGSTGDVVALSGPDGFGG